MTRHHLLLRKYFDSEHGTYWTIQIKLVYGIIALFSSWFKWSQLVLIGPNWF